MKVKVRSLDGDTDFFDIVAGVLHGDTLAPYLFIICQDYVLQTSIDLMKENGITLAKKRSRRYTKQTITDADYTDNIALLANTPAQTESLLHSLKRAAGSISLHVNADKTEFMSLGQRSDISTLNGISLKLVDKFTYLGCNVSSTRLAKAWTAVIKSFFLYTLSFSLIISSNIHCCFNKNFPEFKVLNKAIIIEMFNVDFHYKFIKF